MNRKAAVFVAVALLLLVLVGLWRSQRFQFGHADPASASPQSATAVISGPPPEQESKRGEGIPELPGVKLTREDKSKIQKIVEVFSVPISFWGKVIDQNGNPVPKAAIHFSFADKYFKEGTKRSALADDQGFFAIEDGKGAGVYVSVYKDGYYGTSQSSGSFGYGAPVGLPRPTRDNPAIFVLHKMGEAEPMIKSMGTVRVPRDGTPVAITLRKERPVLVGREQGDLVIEVWTDDANKDDRRRYDWRCRVTVPSGGLVERTDQLDFFAPAEGYSSEFEHTALRTGPRWTNNLKREFFLKLPDGVFARLSFELAAGGDHFVYLESFLNPKIGRRNLEYNPQLSIGTTKP